MKIAIQGHIIRGKEVIQILENLGGKNIHELWGNAKSSVQYYHIDDCGIIAFSSKYDLCNYKFYTLEEFEMQFPFKIGDKVIHKEYNSPFEIIEFDPENVYPYTINGPCEFSTKSYVLTKWQLKMKEERNIKLTLDKAKEWYKKEGELREIALQAFTEEELTKVNLPKTWEEFCKNYPIEKDEFFINSLSELSESTYTRNRCSKEDKNVCSSQKSAEAHLAMIQLEQLRDCWRQGWKPTPNQSVYAIKFAIRGLDVYEYCSREFLSFKDRKTAIEFLKCFRDLIEKAGDLI